MIRRLVPEEYRDLLDYISPAAFKVIDWKKAMEQFFHMSKRALDRNNVVELAQHNARYCSDRMVLGSSPTAAQPTTDHQTTPPAKEQLARQILDVYFSQFFSDRGALIDLRLRHFTPSGDSVRYDPGSFAHVFADEFRLGMLDIYEGYYLDQDEQMERGMLRVGLIRGSEEVEHTKKLLFSHFGTANQGPITFDLAHFKASFHELFLHLKAKNIRLSSDFLFLGIYLVTLYLAMSQLMQPVDVKNCFLTVWQRNRP